MQQEAHPENHHPWSLPFIPLPASKTSKRVRRTLHPGPLDGKHEPELTLFGEDEKPVDTAPTGKDVPLEPREPDVQPNGFWKFGKPKPKTKGKGKSMVNGKDSSSGEGETSGGADGKHAHAHGMPKLNPEEYQHARKTLKRAVLEYYRYALCTHLFRG